MVMRIRGPCEFADDASATMKSSICPSPRMILQGRMSLPMIVIVPFATVSVQRVGLRNRVDPVIDVHERPAVGCRA
jgi:hypothetical protein